MTARRARPVAAALAPVPALALGGVVMHAEGLPATLQVTNLAAAAVGMGLVALAAVALFPAHGARRGPPLREPASGSPRRGGWRVLMGLILLAVPLTAPGIEGVHRWLPLGPVHLHAGALVLPPLLVALYRAPWIPAVATAVATLGMLALQPDAAQAGAFCGAWVAMALIRRQGRAGGVVVLCLLLALAAILRADPLAPVPHVEGIVGLATRQSALLGALALPSLAAIPLALAWFLTRPVGVLLALHGTGALLAAWAGHHPVPFLGYGVAPILGYYAAVALSLREDGVRPAQEAARPPGSPRA
ncbi:MAG: hypothetical protein KC645_15805 [Gemmatimonadetes bacterium]|nr:hypothetical protein [Gemmatimonadota bacterium]